MTEIDCKAWFKDKDFTTDWTSTRFPIWLPILSERRETIVDVLEIGAWEGRSAIFFLNYLPNSRVTSIDTFSGSPDYANPVEVEAASGVEQRFDANLAAFGSRSAKITGPSREGLAKLATQGKRFDMIYVDGSHHSFDVYGDGAMAWPLLRPRGIMIFDDYEWHIMPEEIDNPKLGIDAFLDAHAGAYEEIFRGYQIIISKK